MPTVRAKAVARKGTELRYKPYTATHEHYTNT
jgi:hypothetical protein